MRPTAIIAFLLMMGSSLYIPGNDPAQGAPIPQTQIFVRLSVDMITPHSGNLSFYLGDEFSMGRAGSHGGVVNTSCLGDILLRRMFTSLTTDGMDEAEMFGSIIASEGPATLNGYERSFFKEGDSAGIWVISGFEYEDSGSDREYRILSFLEPFHLPKYDPGNWSAMRDYDLAIKDFSRVRLDVRIEADGSMNLDVQGDGTAHRRDPSGESAKISPTFADFTVQGHEFMVSDSMLFNPITMLIFTAVITALGIAVAIFAVIRRRFQGWGWVFPGIYALLLPLPMWFYVRPYMNPYGLLDAGLLFIGSVCIVYSISLHFLPNGERKDMNVEESQLQKIPKFEMPDVIYVDRPVIVKEKNRSGGGADADPYVILGVNKDSSPQEAEKAYRSLVLKYHPDKVGSAPDWVQAEAAKKTDAVIKAYERIRSER